MSKQKINETEYRSLKSDSRVFCRQAGMRQKYYFATEKKAELAIRFCNGEIVRSYYCNTCIGWHTTSKSEEEYTNKKLAFEKYGYDTKSNNKS